MSGSKILTETVCFCHVKRLPHLFKCDSPFVLGGAIRNLPISALRAPMGPSLLLGAPGEDRTRGLLIRSETLYPLSYERMLYVLSC